MMRGHRSNVFARLMTAFFAVILISSPSLAGTTGGLSGHVLDSLTQVPIAGARVTVDQEGSGFGDVIVIFAILAPSANHALKSIWDQLLLPRIKSRLGADAVGEEVEEDSDDEVAERNGSGRTGASEN